MTDFANSGVEIPQDYKLVTRGCCLYEVTKVLTEVLFGFIWAGEGGGISPDDGYMKIPVQWEVQLHEVLIDSER